MKELCKAGLSELIYDSKLQLLVQKYNPLLLKEATSGIGNGYYNRVSSTA